MVLQCYIKILKVGSNVEHAFKYFEQIMFLRLIMAMQIILIIFVIFVLVEKCVCMSGFTFIHSSVIQFLVVLVFIIDE